MARPAAASLHPSARSLAVCATDWSRGSSSSAARTAWPSSAMDELLKSSSKHPCSAVPTPSGLSSAVAPTDPPPLTTDGAPNAAASTTDMPYASYKQGWKLSRVALSTLPSASGPRKSSRTTADGTAARKRSLISLARLASAVAPQSKGRRPFASRWWPIASMTSTKSRGFFSAERRTAHVTRNLPSLPATPCAAQVRLLIAASTLATAGGWCR
mmetsp:Transcript_39610/g.104564  ORF Transcript_39610/g.104564 Transcript_39610/m.104564 type:complete len:214 (-) Transcript_39610:83-724(-)